jgi:hypothetical protein
LNIPGNKNQAPTLYGEGKNGLGGHIHETIYSPRVFGLFNFKHGPGILGLH